MNVLWQDYKSVDILLNTWSSKGWVRKFEVALTDSGPYLWKEVWPPLKMKIKGGHTSSTTVCSKMKVSKINAYKSKNIWVTKIFHTFLVCWILNIYDGVSSKHIFPKKVHFLWTHLKSLFCQNLVFLYFGNFWYFCSKNTSLKVVVKTNWILSFFILLKLKSEIFLCWLAWFHSIVVKWFMIYTFLSFQYPFVGNMYYMTNLKH